HEPAVGAELGAHVGGQLLGGEAQGRVGDGARQPLRDLAVRLGGLEVEHQVAQPEDSSPPEHGRHAAEGDPLPEVGDLMKCVAAEDEVRGTALVVVGEEARLYAGYVAE